MKARFKYHKGNTDVRFYWFDFGLTEEDRAIIDSGCIPMVDQERCMWIRNRDDAEIMNRWCRNITCIKRAGRSPIRWMKRQIQDQIWKCDVRHIVENKA